MDYDVIVIGGGTAGLGAYRRAKALGKKALIIEANDFVTTCANVGCMPSKLLIAAAENMHEINKSHEFGINVGNVKIDEAKLMERVRRERDRFVGFVKKGAENIEEKIIGFARFVDANTITVNDQKLSAKAFVIATGSTPFIPEIFSHIKEEILTNENVFELTALPKSMAVFGAGVIGLELGFAFSHLGVEVSLFNRGNAILHMASDISSTICESVEKQMDFIYNESVTKIEKSADGYKLFYGDHVKEVEKILVTTGRHVNIANLGLENIPGLHMPLSLYDPETTQIGHFPLFFAGDVNNHETLLHEAAKEGIMAGENAATFPGVKVFKRHVHMAIVFASPQIMQVGQTKDLPDDVIKGQVSFADQGRSRVMLKNQGLLNVYFNRHNHMLLGAEMVGPDAEHVAHMLAWLIEKETTLEEILDLPFYHPVIEEGIRTAMRDAFSKI